MLQNTKRYFTSKVQLYPTEALYISCITYVH